MSTLTERTIADLRRQFLEWNVSLPKEVWAEHEATASYLELMAYGKLAPKAYLNSLWTSAGKTSLMVSYIKEHLKTTDLENVGIIVCVPFLRQILDLSGKLEPSQFSVYVSEHATYETEEGEKRKYRELGNPNANDAQVLFTTQQMIETRLAEGQSFADLDYMHYRGKPRQVKIWDEALIPWEELVLSLSELTGSSKFLSDIRSDLLTRIVSIAGDIAELKDGDSYRFPDLEAEFGENWFTIRDTVSEVREKLHDWERKTAYVLWKIGGKTVQVSKDVEGRTIFEWKQSLPDDFFPVLVFDASGRVRTMYHFYAETTDKLSEITEIEQPFTHLTFHHIDLGAGKSAWRNKPGLLLRLTELLLDQEPDRKTLVITHLPDKVGKKRIPSIQDALAERCPHAAWLTWGSHKQTNEFRDYDRLILPGLFYLPQHQIRVTTYASLQTPVSEKLKHAKEYYTAIERGEIMSDLLQAVGRVARGTNEEGKPRPADIYIVASDKQIGSIQELLEETFPGSQYIKMPIPKEIKPRKGSMTKAELLSEVLRTHASKNPGTNLPFKQAKNQCFRGMSTKNWADLRRHKLIQAVLEEIGYEEAKYPGRTYSDHWAPKVAEPALPVAA